MHSPPRKITQADQAAWKIPPVISNWKNIKGYTIPLDKRLAADGRGLQEVQVNDKFAKLSESLFMAERTARTEIEQRAMLIKKMQRKQKEEKEEELRQLAAQARQMHSTTGGHVEREVEGYDTTGRGREGEHEGYGERREGEREYRSGSESEGEEGDEEGARERARIRREREAELKRELRQQQKKVEKGGSAALRDRDRDISEKIALGQAPAGQKQTQFGQSSSTFSFTMYACSQFRVLLTKVCYVCVCCRSTPVQSGCWYEPWLWC